MNFLVNFEFLQFFKNSRKATSTPRVIWVAGLMPKNFFLVFLHISYSKHYSSQISNYISWKDAPYAPQYLILNLFDKIYFWPFSIDFWLSRPFVTMGLALFCVHFRWFFIVFLNMFGNKCIKCFISAVIIIKHYLCITYTVTSWNGKSNIEFFCNF